MSNLGKDITSGFIRMHILHHVSKHTLTGAWMRLELEEHGYRISPGTLYPMLRTMEETGYLKSERLQDRRRRSRSYSITAKGRRALQVAREKLRELHDEVMGDHS